MQNDKLHTHKGIKTFSPEFGLNLDRVMSLMGYKQVLLHNLILNFVWLHDMELNVSLQISSFEEVAPQALGPKLPALKQKPVAFSQLLLF